MHGETVKLLMSLLLIVSCTENMENIRTVNL